MRVIISCNFTLSLPAFLIYRYSSLQRHLALRVKLNVPNSMKGYIIKKTQVTRLRDKHTYNQANPSAFLIQRSGVQSRQNREHIKCLGEKEMNVKVEIESSFFIIIQLGLLTLMEENQGYIGPILTMGVQCHH